MRFFADLHIHSYYSRATSKQLNLEHLNKWGQLKGLSVVASGDITHPQWLDEIQNKLEECEPGLFRLKDEYAIVTQKQVPESCVAKVYFILSGEISTIYKKGDKVRKIHSIVFFPSFAAAIRFQKTLDKIGNIHSDGRPILGLDTRNLLETVLQTDERAQFIPAHIWTPWFSLFGSKSGFDSIEQCFEDLTPHIFALETGLSSDPPMNWRLSALDQYVLVSNSDAHSSNKLAREANVFNTDVSYDALFSALKESATDNFWGTIEFFPQEGKYHLDGHRKCSCCMEPHETIANNNLCPVCGKPAVLGVSYRVEELADRKEGFIPEKAKSFKSLVPLSEVISEILGVGPASKRVDQMYFYLLQELGSELNILLDCPLAEIQRVAGDIFSEAIDRMRQGKVNPTAGYDGEYGIIRIFNEGELDTIGRQGTLFSLSDIQEKKQKSKYRTDTPPLFKTNKVQEKKDIEADENKEQIHAIQFRGAPLIIQAGPGTGKTFTLTNRIAYLINNNYCLPENVLAITFTNMAAHEMKSRLKGLLGNKADNLSVLTFHSFGLKILRDQSGFFGRSADFRIINPAEDSYFLFEFKRRIKTAPSVFDLISLFKSSGYFPDSLPKEIIEKHENIDNIFTVYEDLLVELDAVDLDDLITLPYRLLSQNPNLRREYLLKYNCIAVDEFQDINKMQYELFKMLAITAHDVCVIGDPDQAIYGFRGASARFFTHFTKNFPGAKFFRLSRNYRSAQNILSASIQMLKEGFVKKDEQLWSNIAPQVKVHIESSSTEKAEAEYIVHKIEQHVGGTTFFSLDSQRVDDQGLPQDFAFSDFAILLRSRQQMPPLFEALERSGIPFQTIDKNLFIRQDFKELLVCSLQLLLNWNLHTFSWYNAIHYFYQAIPQKMETIISQNSLDINNLPDDKSTQDLLIFYRMIQGSKGLPISLLIEKLVKYFPKEQLEIDKIYELSDLYAADYQKFLDVLMLRRDVDNMDKNADKVQILTLHASKGLEFPIVFIPGCEDGTIPHVHKGEKIDINEERRLLYVGMTRAKTYLYLTLAKKRIVFGKKLIRESSRFLFPISQSLIEKEQRIFVRKKKKDQLSLF